MGAIYDRIGSTYSHRRQAEPRIASAIDRALAGCSTVLNVGAGTGSYEPSHLRVVAVEPSQVMIDQRTPGAPPCIQASAESLPFPDQSFDAVLAVMTIHHWSDLDRGLSECARVGRRTVVLTTDMNAFANFWLFDYFPQLLAVDRAAFPELNCFDQSFASSRVEVVPIPATCRDGFLGAYWRRPEAYLDPVVRASISTFSKAADVETGLVALANDLGSGDWHEKYRHILDLEDLDLGYRLVTATNGPLPS